MTASPARAPVDLVDPFHGTRAVATPVPRGIAAAWNWEKAQVGNTHPGACAPFGMVSACAYSGAYPSGYGVYGPSYCGPTPRLFDRKTARGFTHFQQSGTGDIRAFYNYVRVVPFAGETARMDDRSDLVDESARPGYYAATLAPSGIRAELTVSGACAVHRYTFPAAGDACVGIDVATGGLEGDPQRRVCPSEARVVRCSDGAACGSIVMAGFRIYFHAEVEMGGARGALWAGTAERGGGELLFGPGDEELRGPFGALFRGRPGADGRVVVRIGFSFRSTGRARENLRAVAGRGFDEVAAATRQEWRACLSRVRVEGGDAGRHGIFYSSLYHSLIKPIDCTGESPWWSADAPFFLDFATMWDMYKTQLPLAMTVCPDRGRAIAGAMARAMEFHGYFPTAYLIDGDLDRCGEQARGLAHFTLFDAYVRGLGGVDWRSAAGTMARIVDATADEIARRDRAARRHTHVLDLAGAAHATARLADGLGDGATRDRMAAHAARWRDVFDPATGLLREDSRYYEGTLWNYSFRLLPDMAGRIALAGGDEAFVRLLDTFFGYGDVASGAVDPAPAPAAFARVQRRDRFEGLNNEPDMESPYAYVYAGRHDRTAEVVRAAMTYQFATGEGGLAGNDDSGGLSSWYVWNAIGLFPVAGQDLYLVGSPLFDVARVSLGDGEFTIEARGNADAHPYVQCAELDGAPLERAWLRVGEVRPRGRLVLHMGPAPGVWGRGHRPAAG